MMKFHNLPLAIGHEMWYDIKDIIRESRKAIYRTRCTSLE